MRLLIENYYKSIIANKKYTDLPCLKEITSKLNHSDNKSIAKKNNMRLTSNMRILVATVVLATTCLIQGAQAGQGCPFDDGSCQEYCGQQGCHMGYCGHFAWIQCICRKCGDEWNWYDKVHYNPDKTVNQTELDSLKLNGTAPIILTTNNQQQQQVAAAKPATTTPASTLNPEAIVIKTTTTTSSSTTTKAPAERQQQQQATLTTLLIPDLSDKSSDTNNIPDENSEKFLDYLAKNHERLTAAARDVQPDGSEESDEEGATDSSQQGNGSTGGTNDEDSVEIQISSSDNQTTTTTTSTTTATPTSAPASGSAQVQLAAGNGAARAADEQEPVTSQQSATKRLIRLAVIERNSEEIV